MSETSPRAPSGATKPTIPLRASAKPLNPSAFPAEPGDIPAHTPPFQAFDWLDGVDHVDAATRALVNDTINVCTGVSLVLRMIEKIGVDNDLDDPEGVVMLSDGTCAEQPYMPYLDPNDCAALSSLAATAVSLLADRAHLYAHNLRR